MDKEGEADENYQLEAMKTIGPETLVDTLEGSLWRATFTLGSEGEVRYDFADGLHLFNRESETEVILM